MSEVVPDRESTTDLEFGEKLMEAMRSSGIDLDASAKRLLSESEASIASLRTLEFGSRSETGQEEA